MDKYLVGANPIETGGVARVYCGVHRESEQTCAIKEIPYSNDTHHIDTEIAISTCVDSLFLVRVDDHFVHNGHHYFVMDLYEGSDLFWQLEQTPTNVLKRRTVCFLLAELACALFALHRLDVIHRDVKLENIYVQRDGHIALGDFNMAVRVSAATDYHASGLCGTTDFIAPEILRSCAYTRSVDWWSYGVVAYALLVGSIPYANEEEVLAEKLPEPARKWIKNPVDAAFVSAFIDDCPAAERLGMRGEAALRTHPFFGAINWGDLAARRAVPPWTPKIRYKKYDRATSSFPFD